MKQLHPRTFWLFFIPAFFKWLFIFSFFGIYGIIIMFARISGDVNSIGSLFWWILIAFVFLIVWIVTWAKLSCRFYKYELTDDGFRKEESTALETLVTGPSDAWVHCPNLETVYVSERIHQVFASGIASL